MKFKETVKAVVAYVVAKLKAAYAAVVAYFKG